MRRVLVCLTMLVPLLLLAGGARAQSGWIGPLSSDINILNGLMPPINQSQPGWTPVLDLKQSDGTAAVPPCSDPLVIATVKKGILSNIDQQPGILANSAFGKKAELFAVWVHPTYSSGTVCDMKVQLDVPMTGPEEWEFEAFANDGVTDVFFYDKDDQRPN